MDRETIRAKIKEAIASVSRLDISKIPDNASYKDDLHLDSLAILEVFINIDYEFRLQLPAQSLTGLTTIDELVRIVHDRVSERA